MLLPCIPVRKAVNRLANDQDYYSVFANHTRDFVMSSFSRTLRLSTFMNAKEDEFYAEN